tara:strand:- start:248798 stop:249007 length:210 start_codon:yes stop_codon:yes gene_type:complete
MSSTIVVGEFKNQTTGAICTVIKLLPTNGRADNACYVTDDAEYLESDPSDASRFTTPSGEVLVAASALR